MYMMNAPKMAPAGAESTSKKYGAFLNSFHPNVKRLVGKLERINDKIGRNEESVLFNRACVCACVRVKIKIITREWEN